MNEESRQVDGLGTDMPIEDLIASLDDLRQGGRLSLQLPGYQERPAQLIMATKVVYALQKKIHALLEAGTGTGKTWSYLVPLIYSGKTAVISTANRALQDQLFRKDIPFLQKYVKPFEAALVKGMQNYVCKWRLEEVRSEPVYAKNQEVQKVLDLVEDPSSTFNGDFENLGFSLSKGMRYQLSTERDQCTWNKCAFFTDCFVRKARERAFSAQIIVVNHTLLLLDAAIGGFLLPEHDVVVVDEGHHLEDEATRAFTATVSLAQIESLFRQRMYQAASYVLLRDEAMRLAVLAWQRLNDLLLPRIKKERVLLPRPIEEGLQLAEVIEQLATDMERRRPKDENSQEYALFERMFRRTQNLAERVRFVFSVEKLDKYVYYVERVGGTRGSMLQAVAAPLDVAPWLQEYLFKKWPIIVTSATLATVGGNKGKERQTGPSFSYFRRRVGLDQEIFPSVVETILPLAFDYANRSLLYIPTIETVPEPTYGESEQAQAYVKAVARQMEWLIKAAHGRTFLLFSSRKMLNAVYTLLQEVDLPYPLLKQEDNARAELIERFKQESSVLFGVKSFWEGIDIPGSALSLVVIDRLPFDPPDDPVQEAKMKAAGTDGFRDLVLPQTVLRLKQGLGRLLRTREDRGVLAILDTRLRSRWYAGSILACLPPSRRTSSLREVSSFFSESTSDM